MSGCLPIAVEYQVDISQYSDAWFQKDFYGVVFCFNCFTGLAYKHAQYQAGNSLAPDYRVTGLPKNCGLPQMPLT